MNRKIVSTLSAFLLVLYPAGLARGDDPVPANAPVTILTGGEVCTVYVDGKEVGDSPIAIFVTPGKHEIKVVSEDLGEVKKKTINAKAKKTTTVRFDFPVPKPVEAAAKGDFGQESTASLKTIGLSIAGICVIGGAVVLAYNYGSSGGLHSVRVSQQNINLSVKSNLTPADSDSIDLVVNGTTELDDWILTAADNTVAVVLNSGSNVIEIVAINEGTIPPNTGTLTISHVTSGNATQQWSISTGDTATLVIVAP